MLQGVNISHLVGPPFLKTNYKVGLLSVKFNSAAKQGGGRALLPASREMIVSDDNDFAVDRLE